MYRVGASLICSTICDKTANDVYVQGTAVVPDGLAKLLVRRAALVVWRERVYELVLCFWYGPCSSHFLLKFDCSLTAEFSARTIVQQDLTGLWIKSVDLYYE